MLRRAIVVGASSGIGAALVRKLVAEGYVVACVARRSEALASLCDDLNAGRPDTRAYPFVHDVTETTAVDGLFDEIVSTLDGLDALVYSAGVMPDIAEDQYDTAVDKTIIDVNVIGAMAWCNAAARRFEVLGLGSIVGIGSVAGDRGRVGNPAYCASKAALHTYLEAVRNRLGPKGVHVLTVKPGPVHTPMTKGKEKLPMVIEADQAARSIFGAMSRKANTVYVPFQWAPIMAVIKAIPSPIFQKLGI